MLYKNTKTGTIVNVKSTIHGYWIKVEEPKKPTPKKTTTKKKKVK